MKMMASREPIKKGTLSANQTNFVLHKSQQTIFNGIQSMIIDFTEHKLNKFAEGIIDQQQRLVVMALIVDYRKGEVAIAWKNGDPVFVRVSKT